MHFRVFLTNMADHVRGDGISMLHIYCFGSLASKFERGVRNIEFWQGGNQKD